MNYVWAGMILLSLVAGIINGNIDATVAAGMEGARGALETVLSFAGIMCLWSGFIRLADAGGISAVIEKLLKPVTKFLFPKLSQGSKALKCITVNMTANFLGMGNAATPAGIEAMQELDRLNSESEYPSDEMCMLVVVNTASLQLIPTTIIAMRTAMGSKNPFEIMIPVWICSVTALMAGVISMKKICKMRRNR